MLGSGCLERSTLWFFTVKGGEQTECVASYGWAVCSCETLWMVWSGICYGQHEISLPFLMAFWMHSNTVMISWFPLLSHSSMNSICSTTRCPMLPGSPHNSWKLNTSQFLHAFSSLKNVTHWACLENWIDVYNCVFQSLAISSNLTQSLKPRRV